MVIVTDSNKDRMETRSQVDLQGQPFTVLKAHKEDLTIKVQAIKVEERSVAESGVMIYGNPAYGDWGSNNWGVLTSELSVMRVVPPNNTFEEFFVGTEFIDVDGSTPSFENNYANFDLTSEVLISEIIYMNETPVTTARMTATTTSDISSFTLSLSNTSTPSWSTVSNAVTHTFTDATGEIVRYKVVPTTPGVKLSKIKVEVNV